MPFEDEFRERPRGFWLREMFGVFLLFWMVLLLMSLLSYSPSDPSLNHAMSRGKVTNLGGLLGAYTAGFLNDLFGSGSLLLPLLLGGIGLGFLSQRLALTWWRWLGCALTSFSVLVFLAALDVHIGDLQAKACSRPLAQPFCGSFSFLWVFSSSSICPGAESWTGWAPFFRALLSATRTKRRTGKGIGETLSSWRMKTDPVPHACAR